MKNLIPFVLLCMSCMSCKSYKRADKLTYSHLSTLAFASFMSSTDVVLTKSVVVIESPDGTVLNSYKSENLPNSSFNMKQLIIVPFGSYRFHLQYLDQDGKILYQSCSEDHSKIYDIEEPQFPVEAHLCKVGSTEVEPTGDGPDL